MARGTSVPTREFGAERPRAASDLRGDLFQADDAGERAHFLFLIFAQLNQQWHRGRFQLLDFRGVRIDRRRGRVRIGLAGCVNFPATARSALSTAGQQDSWSEESLRRSLMPAICTSLSNA